MSNTQLYLAIAVPLLFNGGIVAILAMYVKSGFGDLHRRMDEMLVRLDRIEKKLDDHAERISRLEERTSPLAR